MCRFQVRIRSCCCCSLFVATILTLIYCFIFYGVSLGLSSWGLAKSVGFTESSYYRTCRDEAKNGESYTYDAEGNRIRVVDVSSTPYFCSLGLYFEELKYEVFHRFPVLIFDVIVFAAIILAIIIAVAGLCVRIHWLLLPLIAMLSIDIIRGTISTILIFVFSYGSLIRIAVGIFFLGVQIFHVSLVLVLVAQFQWMYDLIHGIVDARPAEKWVVGGEAAAYPTLPSHYAYNESPQSRREGYYQPQGPPAQYANAAYSTYDPRYH